MLGNHFRPFHETHGLGQGNRRLVRASIASLSFFILVLTRPGALPADAAPPDSPPTTPIPFRGYVVAADDDEQHADLSLTVEDGPDPVEAGTALVYTIDIGNAGPDDASRVKMSDTLPLGASYLQATGDGWACAFASGKVTCTREQLAEGGATRITLTVRAPNTATTLSNTVTVSSATKDPEHDDNHATATTTVTSPSGVADLGIAVTDGPDPVDAGASLTYTLTITNAGPDAADGVTVTDDLPGSVTFVSASGSGWSCNEDAGTVRCTRETLAVGQAPAIAIAVTAPASGDSISNTATVASATSDPVSNNDSDTASTSITAVADVSIAIADDADPVNAGANLTYTLTAANAGPSAASGIRVADTLPAGVTYQSFSGTGWTCGEASGVVTCTRSGLSAGTTRTVSLVVRTPGESTTLINTASITTDTVDRNLGNNSATEQTSVRPPSTRADLGIAIHDDPDPVDGGHGLDYTLAVSNAGPDAASSVSVVNTLPSGVTFISASGNGWSCTRAGSVVTCARLNLNVGNAPSITIRVTAPEGAGTLVDTATVTSATEDPVGADNSATETTTVTEVPRDADLSLTQSDAPDPVSTGASLTYTLSVANAGPGTASDVRVTDTLPADAVFVTASGSGWTCGRDNRTVTCTRASLTVGSAPPLAITLVAPPDAGSMENAARVASATNDPASSNNAAIESTTVVAAADLSLQETDTPDPVPTGQRITAVLSVVNAGPSRATSVTVTDTLPSGVTFVSASGGGWSCSQASGIVTCSRSTLPIGDAPSISIMFMAPTTAGTITNRASITASETDVHTSDNHTSSSTTVLAPADVNDIAITKIKAPSKVKLKASAASKKVDVIVQIQNRGGHQEVIQDRAILARLVTLDVQSVGPCTGPAATVSSFTLGSANKLDVHFDVTFDCANDPLRGDGDYRYVATVHRAVLDGRADVHPADDVCPRSVDPPYVVDPYPNGKIRDKGCGKPKPDGTKGAPVMTDVIGP